MAKKSAKTPKTESKQRSAEVKRLRTDLKASEAKVAKLEKKLAKLVRRAESAPLVQEPAAEQPMAQDAAGPDASWTVPRLREEARSRGVVYTGKTKAQLLAELT